MLVERYGVKLPDIAWGKWVKAGRHTIGGDKRAYQSFKHQEVIIPHDFCLARYPITNAQFQCYVEADDFADEQWWTDMPAIAGDWSGKKYPVQEIAEQIFSYANHPRVMVSWYQARAFCRWLSDKLGMDIRLPHEYEWEVAVRWPDGQVLSLGRSL